MFTRRDDKGNIIKVMNLWEYREKKRNKYNEYKRSPEYQLWTEFQKTK